MKQKLFVLLGFLIGLLSCQKEKDAVQTTEINHTAKEFDYNRFFPSSQSDNPVVKRIFSYLKSENSKKDFLSAFVKTAGYPRWDKILLKNKQQEGNATCIIPLVSENNTAISGILIAELSDDQVKCRYSLLTDYGEMGELKKKFVLSMIQLEKLVFGHTDFKIYDHSLLGSANSIFLQNYQPKNKLALSQQANTLDEPCEIVEIWYDPTAEECHCSGDEYYTGEWYYEGDCFSTPGIPYILPTGGGGSYSLPDTGTGGGGGGSNPPPYASAFTEKLNYLLSQLDMTPESNDFLPTSEPTVNEMYHYLYTNSSDDRKETASDHIQKLATDPDYSSFVADYRTDAGNSNTQWWENQDWLEDPLNFRLDITQANNQYDELTAAEKVLVGIYPLQAYTISQNLQPSLEMSDARMGAGTNEGLNDKKDAFRHAFFNAINTRDVHARIFGPYAATGSQIVSMFALAHESEVPTQLQLEKQMDIFNNNVGISYCWNCWTTSNSSVADAIMTKLINGELKYLSPLNLSNSPRWPAGLNGILPSTTLKWTNQ